MELTVTTAIAKICQAEEVKKQQPLLRGETPAAGRLDIPVGAVQRGRRSGRLNKKPKSAPHTLNSQPTNCTRCGRTPLHDRRSCPARDAICHKCSTWGHFQVVCRSTAKVGEIHQDDPNEFLGGWTHGILWVTCGDCPYCSMGHIPSLTSTQEQRSVWYRNLNTRRLEVRSFLHRVEDWGAPEITPFQWLMVTYASVWSWRNSTRVCSGELRHGRCHFCTRYTGVYKNQ